MNSAFTSAFSIQHCLEGLMRAVLSLAALLAATTLGVVWAQQQTTQLPPSSPVELRPGQRPRPGEGREPELPAPRSPSTSRGRRWSFPQHPVPRAKFPVIDIHSHQPTPISAADFANASWMGWSEQPASAGQPERRLRRAPAAGLEAIRGQQVPDRMVLFANVDFRECRARVRREGGGAARGRTSRPAPWA